MKTLGSLLVAALLVGVIGGDVLAKRKPYYQPDPEEPRVSATEQARQLLAAVERWGGTWTGKATWKDCSIEGPSRISLQVGVVERVLASDGDALMDGLGDLLWAIEGDALVVKRDGLTVSLTATKKTVKLRVETGAGCIGKATVKRATSGMASCDSVRVLAGIKAGCDGLPAASRGDDLAAVEKSWKKWSKLRGKKRTAQAAACTTQQETLRNDVSACGIGLGGARTGIAECDDFLVALDTYVACDKVPQASRDAVKQGADAMRSSWNAESCRQFADAVRQGGGAMGCAM